MPNVIRNRHGERLDFTYHPGAPELSTLVVLGHGVTGNKDRPLLLELNAIHNGTYGHCRRCKQPIALERLEAQPDAVLCLKCASQPQR